MAESWDFLLWLVPLGFAGALIYGISGFGSALLTIPVSSHFLPLPFSLAVFGVADLVSALRVGLENPRLAVKACRYAASPCRCLRGRRPGAY